MNMKLLDIIQENESNPIEDYFDSRAPYQSNNRGGTIDYFDYSDEHIMRFTRGKNLFVSPSFWKPLMDILNDEQRVEVEIFRWAKTEFSNKDITSAILEKSSSGYYATPNSKTIDPEAKAKHMMKHLYDYDPDGPKQIDRRQVIIDKIEGFKENKKWALKSKHISIDRMLDNLEWSDKMIKKYTRILNKMDKPE